MRRRLYQRWFAVLGMVAMLGALAAAPLTAVQAFAQSSMATVSASAAAEKTTADAMPCHKAAQAKPAKHCPSCPQKDCPGIGACLVMCFQPMPMPVVLSESQKPVKSLGPLPARSAIAGGSLIPPLLRPPSI